MKPQVLQLHLYFFKFLLFYKIQVFGLGIYECQISEVGAFTKAVYSLGTHLCHSGPWACSSISTLACFTFPRYPFIIQPEREDNQECLGCTLGLWIRVICHACLPLHLRGTDGKRFLQLEKEKYSWNSIQEEFLMFSFPAPIGWLSVLSLLRARRSQMDN